MSKTALIFSSQGLSPLHLGHELEIIDGLVEKGYKIVSVTCNNQLSTCFFNPTHNLLACAICESRTIKGYRHLENVTSVQLRQYSPRVDIRPVENLDDLMALDYEGINTGRGIASSLISLFREYDIQKIPDIDELIVENQKMVVNAIINFKNLIAEFSPEQVYLFNGRFAEIYGVVQLCKKLDIDYHTFDNYSNTDRYVTRKNTGVHSIKNFQLDMKSIEDRTDREEVVREGRRLFEQRMGGNQGGGYNYLSLQKTGQLPAGFDTTKNNIALFNSSEDEVKTIKDWQFSLYKHQNEALKLTLEHYKNDNTVHFYLRVHPNLLGLRNTQTLEIEELRYDNLTIIGSEQAVDTYALIKASDKIVCFGSTVGIETTYLKKPSILLGNAFYRGLGCVYEPNSYEELFALISEPNLKPKSSFNTFLYIYTVFHTGNKCGKFSYKGVKNSTYNGVVMRRVTLLTLIKCIHYFKNITLWRKMTRLVLKEKLNLSNMLQLKSHTMDRTHRGG